MVPLPKYFSPHKSIYFCPGNVAGCDAAPRGLNVEPLPVEPKGVPVFKGLGFNAKADVDVLPEAGAPKTDDG